MIKIDPPVTAIPNLSTASSMALQPFFHLMIGYQNNEESIACRVYEILNNESLSDEDFKVILAVHPSLIPKFIYQALQDAKGEALALRLMTDSFITKDWSNILKLGSRIGFKRVVEHVLSKVDLKGGKLAGRSPLFSVVMAPEMDDKQIAILHLLADAGLNVNDRDSGCTPLALFLQRGDISDPKKKDQHLKFMTVLIGRGAGVNDKNAEGDTPLHLASDVAFVQLLHSKGANIHLLSNTGIAVIETGKTEEAIRYLVRAGADLQIRHAKRGDKTLLHVKLLRSSPKEVAAFLDTTLTVAEKVQAEYQSRFSLGHYNSIETKKSEEINYNSSLSYESCSQMVKMLTTLPTFFSSQITSEEKKELQGAFELAAATTYDRKKIFSSIKKGKLTILPLGFSGHAIYFVFCNGYMAILNRGVGVPAATSVMPSFIHKLFGSISYDTVKAFKIDYELMTKEIIERLVKLSEGDEKEALEYYYEILPRLLSPNADKKPAYDEVCKQLETLRAKLQKIGNCNSAQAKLSVRLGHAMLNIKKGKGLAGEDAKRAYLFSKDCSSHLRLSLMDHYLSFNPKDYDETLLVKTYQKLKKRLKVFPDLSAYSHFQKGQKYLEELYARWQRGMEINPYRGVLISYHE